jgi:acyl-CoA dehydrogenase
VITARPEGAPEGPRGIRLYFVPSRREDGTKNWRVRRLKEKLGTTAVPTGEVSLEGSEAFLLGTDEEGIVPTMEMLNVSRICNAIGSAGILARATEYALRHAEGRTAFGRRLRDHPLMALDLARLALESTTAALLAFEPAFAFDAVWKERPPRSPEARRLRFATHAAKLTTADQAIRSAFGAMEVLGGAGYLEEFPLAKLVRDAMVVPIWEGGANRQALDADELVGRSHPEELWMTEAKGEVDRLESDPASVLLQDMIRSIEGAPKLEINAKARLQAFSSLRQLTLLARLARSDGPEANEARCRALLELFVSSYRPGSLGPVREGTVEAILALL